MSRKKQNNNIVFALDIGSFEIKTVAAVLKLGKLPEVVGYGTAKSRGVEKGFVVNINNTVEDIKKAVRAVENMSGYKAEKIVLAISGAGIESTTAKGLVKVKGQKVAKEDVAQVIDSAMVFNTPNEKQRLIQVIPQFYYVDGAVKALEPVGMFASKLEVQVTCISAPLSLIKNLESCVQKCNLKISSIVASHLVSSYANIDQYEKELGTFLIDFGAGVVDISVYRNHSLLYLSTLNVGGNLATSDIAHFLKTPKLEAEKLKINHGCVAYQLINEEQIEVVQVGNQPTRFLSKKMLVDIITKRYYEIFDLIIKNLSQNVPHAKDFNPGVVLTGGASNIPGLIEIADEKFFNPVGNSVQTTRIAEVVVLGGKGKEIINNKFSSAVGSILYINQSKEQHSCNPFDISMRNKAKENKPFSSLLNGILGWVKKSF